MLFPSSKSLINCCAALLASALVLNPDFLFLLDLKGGCFTSYCQGVDVYSSFVLINDAILFLLLKIGKKIIRVGGLPEII